MDVPDKMDDLECCKLALNKSESEVQRLERQVKHLRYLLDGAERKAEKRKRHIEVCEAANGRLRRSMGKGMTNEDVEAASWVHQHGGVKNLSKRLMPGGYEWDDRFAGAVDFFEAMHDLLYTVDCDENHDGPEMVREVMRRLMPEGMEWDGSVLRIRTAENVDYDGETLFVLIGGRDE